ncbi:MAG: hypothetical protein ACRDYC_00015, partial [Acidimicrobiales bacterium]
MSATPLHATTNDDGMENENQAKGPGEYKPTRAERLEEKALRGTKRQKANANFWLHAQANLDWWKSVTEPPTKLKPVLPPTMTFGGHHQERRQADHQQGHQEDHFTYRTPFSSSLQSTSSNGRGTPPPRPGGRNYTLLPPAQHTSPGSPAPWTAFRASSSWSPPTPAVPEPSTPGAVVSNLESPFVPPSWRTQVTSARSAKPWQKPVSAPPWGEAPIMAPDWQPTSDTAPPATHRWPKFAAPAETPAAEARPNQPAFPHLRLTSGYAPPAGTKVKIDVPHPEGGPSTDVVNSSSAGKASSAVSDAVAKLSEAVAKVARANGEKTDPPEVPLVQPDEGARKISPEGPAKATANGSKVGHLMASAKATANGSKVGPA